MALAFFALWVCGMANTLCDFIKSFFPVKLKAKKLTCWHIERPEPEHHAWQHCHEYNFAGEISITPRIKAVVTAFYLELPTGKGLLRVDYLQPPPPESRFPQITPGNKIVDLFSFQARLPSQIEVPLYGYVVLKFNRGKAKSKVSIKLDDEYRPGLGA